MSRKHGLSHSDGVSPDPPETLEYGSAELSDTFGEEEQEEKEDEEDELAEKKNP